MLSKHFGQLFFFFKPDERYPSGVKQNWWTLGVLFLNYVMPLNMILRFSLICVSPTPFLAFLFHAFDFMLLYLMAFVEPLASWTGIKLYLYMLVHSTFAMQMQNYLVGNNVLGPLSYFGAIAVRGIGFWSIAIPYVINAVSAPMIWGNFPLWNVFVLQVPLFTTLTGLNMLRLLVEKLNSEKMAKEKEHIMSQSRAELFRLAAHELRNPLQALIYSIQFLDDLKLSELSPDQFMASSEAIGESIEDIKTTSGLMKSLVENVLDFNMIERNKMEFNNQDFSIADIIDNVVEIFSQTAKKKGLDLYSFVDLDIPARLHGDKMRLTQIMCNFCYNAIKFTSKGFLEVRAEIDTRNPLVIKLSCIDTGYGVKVEDVDRIFKPYIVIHQDDSTKGWGLGLPISAEITKHLQGEIGVTRLDQGSDFWVKIPFERHSEELLKNSLRFDTDHDVVLDFNDKKFEKTIENYLKKLNIRVSVTSQLGTKGVNGSMIMTDHAGIKTANTKLIQNPLKIRKMPGLLSRESVTAPKHLSPNPLKEDILQVLIVEDEELIQKLMKRILVTNGIDVVCTSNGLEGLMYLEHCDLMPKVALIDNLMPVMTGKEMIKRIRSHKNPKIQKIPIVMVSASISKDFEAEMKEFHCELMQKPILPKELLSAVRKFAK